ncbi:23S rRNA (uracil(1939)-C(5))-methyltransferase RlmD [Candidatus Uhrbacteria bacterium CG_4_9_14_3_um_filter_36_7]|uniref:23S rRNA (Uracil(1939)-C(5))-methyltransferase RlmD n=1 Tax=Candidatus Uhrbacteria bacterium CG_4_9_14_3_um_filter_36_7 TaxID=1975033 RepID=A0A2M7XII0_9BACT|nr:MAG: 23S rRNA (uracil(1939)-C(5))-methyltransferase RlmD [Candidatus Uhrbacteria bacterium CG_4_9_14_3_um_filter_36_7]
MPPQKIISAIIDHLHSDGSGVFYHEGKSYRIYNTIPQEEIMAKIERKYKGIWRATLQKILCASVDRIEPTCPHASICGGCKWQHISYARQLEEKQQAIKNTFNNQGLICPLSHILACPSVFYYRNRMDYSFDYKGNLGLKQPGYWWSVISLNSCYLLSKDTEKILMSVRKWTHQTGLHFWDAKKHTGFFRSLIIREGKNTHERLVMLVTTRPENVSLSSVRVIFEELKQILKPYTHSFVWGINEKQNETSNPDEIIPINGNPWIEEKINNIRYRIYPNSFFQTNSLMAEKLQQTVIDACGDISGKTILDLYCGAGFFSLAFSKKAKKIIGIEIDDFSIKSARENAKLNHCKIDFFSGAVENFDWQTYKPDLVILDPPRAGLHPHVLKTIIQTLPQTIIYISCNYRRLVEELPAFLNTYKLTSLIALDLFPQTPHVEIVAKLELKSL